MSSSDQVRPSRMRAGRFVFLGVLLLIAFLLPILSQEEDPNTGKTKYEAYFVNVEFLGEEEVPTELAAFLLYPGIAGLAIILIAILLPAPKRSTAFIALGAIGTLLMLFALDSARNLDQVAEAVLTLILGGKTWALLIGAAATIFLLGGSRARWYAAASRPAAILAAVGGGLALVTYVLPSLPDDSLPVVAPFNMLDHDDGAFLGIVLLISMAMVVTAAVLAFVNLRKGTRVTAAKLGNTSFWLVIGSMLVLFIGVWIGLLATLGDMVEGMTATISLGIIKLASLSIGLELLLALGISDLIAARKDASSAADGMPVASPGAKWSRRTEVLGEGPDRDRTVQRRIHELTLLRDEGHLSEEEFQMRRESLEDLL